MTQPNPKPKEEPEDSKPVVPPAENVTAAPPPETKAPPAPESSDSPEPVEILSDLDAYQRRIESQWERTRSSYQKKINSILEEFIEQNGPHLNLLSPSDDVFPPPPPPRQKTKAPGNSKQPGAEPDFRARDAHMAELLARAERAIRASERKGGGRVDPLMFGSPPPPVMSLDWKPTGWLKNRALIIYGSISLLAMGLITSVYLFYRLPAISSLPYLHTSGLIVKNNKVYVVDWFRKALFAHRASRGLPILSVENIPNEFLTGIAFSEKSFWTLDGFHHQLIEHAMNTEHLVNRRVATPGSKPVGLFFDGTDLWSMDDGTKTLYRHRGNDVEDIKDKYTLPNMNLTALAIFKNRLWILNGKGRQLGVYRLEDPVRQLALYDLDFILAGATPTGVAVNKRTVWLSTENPAKLLKISRRKLSSQKPDDF
jgi:hypothetical protein